MSCPGVLLFLGAFEVASVCAALEGMLSHLLDLFYNHLVYTVVIYFNLIVPLAIT